MPDGSVWDFLNYQDPIDDPGMMAFQVAQLTIGMVLIRQELAELKARL